MTNEEIDKLEAGPELDALIAERAMERKDWCRCSGDIHVGMNGCVVCHKEPLLDYSTDIAAAWEVVEKIGKPFKLFWASTGTWLCSNELSDACAETAALAICRAALKAVNDSAR